MGLYNVVGRASMAAGVPEDVTQVLANLDAIAAVLNGNIDNSNVNAAAAIDYSKLNVPDLAMPVAKQAPQPFGKMQLGVNVSIPTGANNNYIPWDGEILDNYLMHSPTVNPAFVIVPSPGLYVAIATLVFAAAAGGDRAVIIQNQAGVRLGGNEVPSAGGVFTTDVSVTVAYPMDTGNYFLVEPYQNSGAALNVVPSDGTRGIISQFTVFRVGSK